MDVTKKALNLSDSISMLLLEQKIVGEQPSLVDTKSLLIGVDRQLPGKVANNKSIVGEGGFLLPQIASFEVHNDSKDTDFIDSTVSGLPYWYRCMLLHKNIISFILIKLTSGNSSIVEEGWFSSGEGTPNYWLYAGFVRS